MQVVELCSVHLRQRLALLTDGQIIPVTALLDEAGDETDDPHEAKAFTAGPDSAGQYHVDSLEGYGFTDKSTIN
jgi:hypothetical protein